MNIEAVSEFIKSNPRCLLTAKSIFGDPVTHEIRPIEIKQHGFNCKSGGWGLYDTKMSESPAYFLVFKRKARRKQSTININEIDDLKPIT